MLPPVPLTLAPNLDAALFARRSGGPPEPGEGGRTERDVWQRQNVQTSVAGRSSAVSVSWLAAKRVSQLGDRAN